MKRQKQRRWHCSGLVNLKRCKNYALIETATNLGTGEHAVRIKVKLCMPCDLRFGAMFPKLSEIQRSPRS